MFEELVVSGKTKPTNKRWTVFVSTVLQGSLLAALILVPLIFTEEMPKELLTTYLVAPPPPPPPPPPAAAVQVVRRHTVEHLLHDNKLTAPTVIPKKINIIKEEADVPDVGNSNGVPGGVPGGTPGGVLNGVIGGVSSPVPPPPP